MSINVKAEVTVRRPRSAVAAYMFDPANDTEWTTGLVDSRPRQQGPLGAGAKVVRTAKFLGRKFDYEFEVVDTDGESFVHMKVDRPFPMQIRYELEDRAEGTLTRIHTWGNPGGFFKLAAPMMAPRVLKNITNDLALLQKHLEVSG